MSIRRGMIGLLAITGCGRLEFDPLRSDGGADTDAFSPPAKRKLVVGWQHSCVLEPSGALYCWGQNANSQLGFVGADQPAPVPVASTMIWTDVALGERHTCALDTQGRAWCWGGNLNSELGLSPPGCGDLSLQNTETCDDGNTANDNNNCTCMCQVGNTPPDVTVPTLIPDGRQYQRIFAMRFTTCAIALDGTLWCWGRNGATQLGVGLPNDDRGAPAQVTIVAPQVGSDTSWALASVGEDHVCATQLDGSLWCWGSNVNQQLGQGGGTPVVRERPSVVVQGSTWIAPAAGNNASCAITAAGALACWGLNSEGQLGLGDLAPRDIPATGDPGPWAVLSFAGSHACAIRATDQTLACWGSNTSGQIGTGDLATPQPTPVTLLGNTWREVDLGSGMSCAIDLNDAVWCWGSGANGKLGTGNSNSTTVPVPVAF